MLEILGRAADFALFMREVILYKQFTLTTIEQLLDQPFLKRENVIDKLGFKEISNGFSPYDAIYRVDNRLYPDKIPQFKVDDKGHLEPYSSVRYFNTRTYMKLFNCKWKNTLESVIIGENYVRYCVSNRSFRKFYDKLRNANYIEIFNPDFASEGFTSIKEKEYHGSKVHQCNIDYGITAFKRCEYAGWADGVYYDNARNDDYNARLFSKGNNKILIREYLNPINTDSQFSFHNINYSFEFYKRSAE